MLDKTVLLHYNDFILIEAHFAKSNLCYGRQGFKVKGTGAEDGSRQRVALAAGKISLLLSQKCGVLSPPPAMGGDPSAYRGEAALCAALFSW